MLSIYAEVRKKLSKIYSVDDYRNEIMEMLTPMPEDAQDLWRKEGLFVESLIPDNWQRPDFEDFCEREIMEKFAKEEAARSI
jgi:hypothetical protein